jgi:hypothetical protein
MQNSDWSVGAFTLAEAALWQEQADTAVDLNWLGQSWNEPHLFWKALLTYAERRLGYPAKSVAGVRYNFYHDLLVQHKAQTKPALIWFEKTQWQTLSYQELNQAVDSLAANWEKQGVQAGEVLALLHPPGPNWLIALLTAFRLGLSVAILPPQGNAFVERRLENIAPTWLAIDPLYRHQLASSWQDKVLSYQLSAAQPTRQSYEYSGSEIAAVCLNPSSPEIDQPVPVTADTLYLSALRDGILALALKPGQICAAPGWHFLESQPALILAVLLCGATWLHIELSALETSPERLLEQPINVLGVSHSLRNLLLRKPLAGKKTWHYWFRHPAEATDLTNWRNFMQVMQLETLFSANLLWNTALGGAILFSARCRGHTHLQVLPAAGQNWQLDIINTQNLPSVAGWGCLSLGKTTADEIVWTPTPYLIAPYRGYWHYLGAYPRGRAGRTFPRQELLALLQPKYDYLALVEVAMFGDNTDPLQVLLVFGKVLVCKDIETCIQRELGAEFMPDRIEYLSILPKRSADGGADPEWCQTHYLSGELYRRQRSTVFSGLATLKMLILAAGNSPNN